MPEKKESRILNRLRAQQLASAGELRAAFQLLVRDAALLTNRALTPYIAATLLPAYRDLLAAEGRLGAGSEFAEAPPPPGLIDELFPSAPPSDEERRDNERAIATRMLHDLVRRVALEEVFRRHEISLVRPWPFAHCPPGWLALVDTLLAELAALGCKQVFDLKPKLGALQIFPNSSDARVEDAVGRAVATSRQTCEQCGAAAVQRTQHPDSTLCAACEPPVAPWNSGPWE